MAAGTDLQLFVHRDQRQEFRLQALAIVARGFAVVVDELVAFLRAPDKLRRPAVLPGLQQQRAKDAGRAPQAPSVPRPGVDGGKEL